MKKLLTIAIPTYNTEHLLPKCLDSIIVEEFMTLLEILIIIDGSPDNSAKVAKTYADKYPNTFFVIEKENGGYSSAVNKGIELATGKYFKFLDSDDWFDNNSFKQFLSLLKEIEVDVVMTDYVRELALENRQELMILNHPVGKIFKESLDEMDFYSMHRITYKLDILKKSNLNFPNKLYYVDTIYARLPMFYAQSFIYYNLPLYRYYIGREGQSISIESYIKNREHLKFIFKYLNEKEREILNGKLKDTYKYKALNEVIFSVLSRLDYNNSKKELSEWKFYLDEKISEGEIKSGKLYKLYNILPFFLYKNLYSMYNSFRVFCNDFFKK